MLAAGWRVRGTVRHHRADVPAGVEIYPISVGPAADWQAALADVDVVVHLAARVHIMSESSPDPEKAFREVNVEGTERLAHAAVAAGVRRFVFLSTVGVHGVASPDRILTEESILDPNNAYARSKLEAERALSRFAAGSKMDIVSIRAPLVYGPGNPGNFVRLLALISKGWPLPFSSVRNRRSFIYIGNLIDLLAQSAIRARVPAGTYLVSDDHDFSTPELLVELGKCLNHPARLFPVPVGLLRLAARLTGRASDMEKLIGSMAVNSARIRRELDWKAPFTALEGIQATASWFSENGGGNAGLQR